MSTLSRGPRFNQSSMVIEAAMLSVAVSPWPRATLAAADLAEGRLVAAVRGQRAGRLRLLRGLPEIQARTLTQSCAPVPRLAAQPRPSAEAPVKLGRGRGVPLERYLQEN